MKSKNYISLIKFKNHNEDKSYKKIIYLLTFFGLLLLQFIFIALKIKERNYYKEITYKLEYKVKELKNVYEKNEINYSKKSKEVEELNIKIKDLENEIKSKSYEFDKKEKYYLEIIKLNNHTLYQKLKQKNNFQKLFIKKITQVYKNKGYINLNKLESTISNGRPWPKQFNKINEINVGSSLDPNYILRTMMTTASLMDSQNNETYLRLHFAVVNNFSTENMLKIYSLREKIRDNVEFNFYNAKNIEKEMKGQASEKGSGLIAKLLLPQLVGKDVERLIIIDNGDLLVLRDLTEMYNWNMSNNLYVGVPDQMIGKFGSVSNKTLNIYINTGNYLIDVKKVKEQNMYEKYLKYRVEYYDSNIADQNIINDIAYGKIGYLPMKFGAHPLFSNDKESDSIPSESVYDLWNFYNKIKISNEYPHLLRNDKDLFLQSYNPVIVHSISEKWMYGGGITLFRRLAQYYIKYAGIWDEMCITLPGYCKI